MVDQETAPPPSPSPSPKKSCPISLRTYGLYMFLCIGIVGGAFLLWNGEGFLSFSEGQIPKSVEERILALEDSQKKIQPLADKMDVLEKTTKAQDVNLETLQNRLKKLQEKSMGDGAVNDLSRIAGLLSQIDLRVQKLEDKIAKGQNLPPIERGSSDISGDPNRLAKLEQQVIDTDKRMNQLTANLRSETAGNDRLAKSAVDLAASAASVVVAQTLKHNIKTGQPFTIDLASLESLGVDPNDIAPLKPYAAQGVLSSQALLDMFTPLAGSILVTQKAEDAQGTLDHLARAFFQFVKIRPVGASKGNDLPSLVARLEEALAAGHVDKAIDIYDQLPASAKAQTQTWAVRARAHVAAQDAASNIFSLSLIRLSRSRL